jgi:hypothetical protein
VVFENRQHLVDPATAGIIVAIAAIIAGAGVTLFVYFHGKRPSLEVRHSRPEQRFKERIEIQNHGQTVYSYRIKVAGTYLKFEKSGSTQITLPPGGGTGVILDEVYEKLLDHQIIIECIGWLPWAQVVYKRLLRNVG